MAQGEFCMEQYHQSLLQKAAGCMEELRRANTASLIVRKWVVPPRIAHKHDDIFPSIAFRIHVHLFSLFLDVWEVHYHGHPLWQNWETNTFSWSSYPMGQLERCKYQPVANDQFISSFMGSTLQSVKRFLEVALQLKPEILNFRMNLSIFMNCRSHNFILS